MRPASIVHYIAVMISHVLCVIYKNSDSSIKLSVEFSIASDFTVTPYSERRRLAPGDIILVSKIEFSAPEAVDVVFDLMSFGEMDTNKCERAHRITSGKYKELSRAVEIVVNNLKDDYYYCVRCMTTSNGKSYFSGVHQYRSISKKFSHESNFVERANKLAKEKSKEKWLSIFWVGLIIGLILFLILALFIPSLEPIVKLLHEVFNLVAGRL